MTRKRLRYMADFRAKSYSGPIPDQVAFLPMDAVGDHGEFDPDCLRPAKEVPPGYTYFERGDVIRAKVTPCFENGKGAVLGDLPAQSGLGSTELLAMKPRAGTDPRFLYYVLQSAQFVQGGVSWLYGAHGVKRVPESYFQNFAAWSPELTKQQEIADYLDRETARIGTLIERNRHRLNLISERAERVFTDLTEKHGVRFPKSLNESWQDACVPPGWQVRRLSQVLVQLTNGYVGPTREILRDDGVPYIQSLHIKDGEIRFDRGPYYVGATWHLERPRINLRPGDVLIVQTGDIGQVAVVPPGFGEASCHALQIARVRPNVVSPEYLAAFLRSPFGRQSLLAQASGALHPHLEASIKAIAILVPPRDIQDEITRAVELTDRLRKRSAAAIRAQIELLSERRLALITAVVTGQVPTPNAA